MANAIDRKVTAKHQGKVVATLQAGPGNAERSVDVAPDGSYTLSLDGLPPGTYRVVELDFPLDAGGNRLKDRDGLVGPKGIDAYTVVI